MIYWDDNPMNISETTLKKIGAGAIIIIFFIMTGQYYRSERKKQAQQSNQANTMMETVRVPILTYHSIRPYYPGETTFVKEFDVQPSIFEKQLDYLNEQGYVGISFRDLIDHLNTGKPLPKKPVILSFDDGWENQYEYATPILKRKGFTATFFIFTNAIGHKKYMTWDQVIALDAAKMTIGSHTKSHPYLSKMTDRAALWREIAESKAIIESHLHKPTYVFAYPFGLYNNEDVSMVKEIGYEAARSTHWGWSHTKSDLFTLKSIQAATDLSAFIRDLNQ